MKKFSQYLAPKEKEKNLSLTEKVWLEAKKKVEQIQQNEKQQQIQDK